MATPSPPDPYMALSTPHNSTVDIRPERLAGRDRLFQSLKEHSQRTTADYSLPRPATFRRQSSEHRERLTPPSPTPSANMSTASVDQRSTRGARPSLPPLTNSPSVLETSTPFHSDEQPVKDMQVLNSQQPSQQNPPDVQPGTVGPLLDDYTMAELDEKWIFNLSMHFRDRSAREKFFVTYAETPTRWRKVTVSCDYRDAPQNSLEQDLQVLQHQRDKSACIYEALRDSLSDIQFYDTVTNLKLQTREERLHVHVTEDINEIIPYPSVQAIKHLDIAHVRESNVHYCSHLSGFTYLVKVDGHAQICYKQEISAPEAVDEFLSDINALYSLLQSSNAIPLLGIVVDEQNTVVKGILTDPREPECNFPRLSTRYNDFSGPELWGGKPQEPSIDSTTFSITDFAEPLQSMARRRRSTKDKTTTFHPACADCEMNFTNHNDLLYDNTFVLL